jgi:hypothetical protein
MEADLASTLVHMIRATLSAWLFTIGGAILVVSQPRWRGSWVLLLGAIVLSAFAGVRLIGFVPRDANVWVLVALEAGDTLGYVLSGLGILLVSIRARKDASEPA